MGLFSRKKKEESVAPAKTAPKGFHALTVSDIVPLTAGSVQVVFDVPTSLASEYDFIPGQYVNLSAVINGAEERRSYSICSGLGEKLAVAIKRVNNGKFSNWANDDLEVGMSVYVAPPMGNFQLDSVSKNIVAFAAGSGITPIVSMAKSLEQKGGTLHLFYGNRAQKDIMFRSELEGLSNTQTLHYLSAESVEGFRVGRLSKENISAIIKENLELLKADGFFLCGPETMIQSAIEVLTLFGVPKNKINYELYTTPVLLIEDKPVEVNHFEGESNVTVILDDETIELKLSAAGKTILDAVNKEGYDAPYSCRGGVCCTCRAKVLKGKVTMSLNYSLTDKEVADGYILTCQAHPASEEVTISYDV